jgi:chaperone modulatory protein CbpM
MSGSGALRGQVVGRESLISVTELCRHCTIETEQVVTLVREGVIDPVDDRIDPREVDAWRFHISCVRRVRTVVRLQRDLGVNLAGAALALELLDRIEALRRRV